jgi:hypothetical protein
MYRRCKVASNTRILPSQQAGRRSSIAQPIHTAALLAAYIGSRAGRQDAYRKRIRCQVRSISLATGMARAKTIGVMKSSIYRSTQVKEYPVTSIHIGHSVLKKPKHMSLCRWFIRELNCGTLAGNTAN